MTNIFAYWPNKTWTVLQAKTMYDLFWQLDTEGDPGCASLRILPNGFALAHTGHTLPAIVSHEGLDIGKLPRVSIAKIHEALDKHTSCQKEQRKWIREKTIKQAVKFAKRYA